MNKFVYLIMIILLTLTSCIGIESQISFRGDGSGTLTLIYTVSQMIKDLDTGGNDKNLPLPVSEEEFNRTVENIDGLNLLNIKQKEDEENIYIEASLEFDSIDALNQIGNRNQMDLSLTVENGITTFRQVIFGSNEDQEVSEDSIKMLETFFKGYELSFVINTPSSIKEYSLGELNPDNKKLTYRVTIPELMRMDGEKILEVRW